MNLPKAKTVLLSAHLCAVASSKTIRGSGTHRNLDNLSSGRIIGGGEAREGRYPYSVSLQDEWGHFCGGSLIAPDVVLSAAHCAGGEYKCVIGRHNMETDDGDEVEVDVEMMHPDYDADATDNDFMLLFLKRPTTEVVDPVQVGSGVISDGTDVTTIGWGDTHEDQDIYEGAIRLNEVGVTVISNEECEKSESDEDGWEYDYHDQITENMMCAKDNGEDACQGDSGGPLVAHSDSGDIQVGVVSWGIGCAHRDFPGVYSRVSSQYDWIKRNVCQGSSSPPASFDCTSVDGTTTNTANDVAESSATQEDLGIQAAQNLDGWTTILEEDFTYGFGLFYHHDNNANHYTSSKNRLGVVHIKGGEGGSSVLESNPISLENTTFSRIKVSFSFYSVNLQHSDNVCLEYELDNGAVTGHKCWSTLHAFENSRWYDDMSFEFDASDANILVIGLKVEGDLGDHVLIDSVSVQGQI